MFRPGECEITLIAEVGAPKLPLNFYFLRPSESALRPPDSCDASLRGNIPAASNVFSSFGSPLLKIELGALSADPSCFGRFMLMVPELSSQQLSWMPTTRKPGGNFLVFGAKIVGFQAGGGFFPSICGCEPIRGSFQARESIQSMGPAECLKRCKAPLRSRT
jgi:hypothetical protein